MNDARAYRDGAARVRTDARAKLASLRAERAAGTFRVVEGDAPRQTTAESPAAPASRSGFQPSARARAFAEAAANDGAAVAATPRPNDDAVVEDAKPAPKAPRASRAAVAEARKAAKVAETEAGSETARQRRSRKPRPAPITEAPVTVDEATAAAPTSDLDTLPGAGPGLVWLLTNAGYTNLAELATADAEALRDKLGLIGLLVNLEGWIAFAEKSTQPPAPAKISRRRSR